jgi:tartrate-resistant acid phosphatase type 5
MKRWLLALFAPLAACGRTEHIVHPPDMYTPPPADVVARFAAMGDYGSGSIYEGYVASTIKAWNPDYILALGDNNYPSGEAATIDAHIGQFYSDYIGGYIGMYGHGADMNRFWPCIGNHDRYSTPPLQPYLDYFHILPGNQRYYDVVIGNVHLFSVDSTSIYDKPPEPDGVTPTSIQGMWLQDKLASSKACLKVVFFHHPPYSSGLYGVPGMQWPFKEWGADVILTGHEHFYERLEVDGMPYITAGLGGDDKFGFNTTPDPHSVVRFNTDFGALFVTVEHQKVTYEFRTIGGMLIDTLTLPVKCP